VRASNRRLRISASSSTSRIGECMTAYPKNDALLTFTLC